jgi:hypothetical protein
MIVRAGMWQKPQELNSLQGPVSDPARNNFIVERTSFSLRKLSAQLNRRHGARINNLGSLETATLQTHFA